MCNIKCFGIPVVHLGNRNCRSFWDLKKYEAVPGKHSVDYLPPPPLPRPQNAAVLGTWHAMRKFLHS